MPRARANGLELEYESLGNSADPALLLIMGLGAQLVLWDDEFCQRLVARGFRVIRYDNRDCGGSTKLDELGVPNMLAALLASAQRMPVQSPYSLGDMARDAVGLLDALDIRAAHVVGSSMGGMIGQILAIEHPERVLSLTSIMSTSGDPTVPPAAPHLVALLGKEREGEREPFIAQMLEISRAVSGTLPFDEERARRRAEMTFDRGDHTNGALRQFTAILAASNRHQALTRVRVPTLVIHGDADPLSHLAGGRDTAKAVPGAQLMIMPGMGHDLPPAVWDPVVNAIAKLAGR